VLTVVTSEATGAGVESDLVFLRGAMVSRVLKVEGVEGVKGVEKRVGSSSMK
jgi:hypothetical protein